jgi:hypothetical protein
VSGEERIALEGVGPAERAFVADGLSCGRMDRVEITHNGSRSRAETSRRPSADRRALIGSRPPALVHVYACVLGSRVQPGAWQRTWFRQRQVLEPSAPVGCAAC